MILLYTDKTTGEEIFEIMEAIIRDQDLIVKSRVKMNVDKTNTNSMLVARTE